ncbi:lipocalin-like domain-containing protein [Erythrobacter dokdonensis]|uniref:lipocalin-like domain-containing protein n=1 Tax=Erythrobacter dokdonensis TaxID=328225 RepID=UPI00083A296C|nr:lipocalin-like domain-containing protein [Erythrobacter dokdonensis]
MSPVALALATALLTSQAQSEPNDPCLFGIWEVVEWSDLDSEGNPMQPDRSGAKGRFIYTPGGLLSVQVMLDPNSAPIEGRQDVDGLADAARSTVEYFGQYQADAENGSLTHHIVGSGIPNRRGTDAVRSYAMKDGKLLIFWNEPDGRRFSRTLELLERLGDIPCEL